MSDDKNLKVESKDTKRKPSDYASYGTVERKAASEDPKEKKDRYLFK